MMKQLIILVVLLLISFAAY
ncbi:MULTISPECIES: type I toxin-antitoxin system Ibs family toxin [Kluyvera]